LFLVVTLVAALFAGCVKEYTGNVEDDGYTYEKGKISFALPSSGKKVTYQTRATTEAGEDDLANLVIYQFGSTGYLEKIYAEGITIDGARTIEIEGTDNSDRVATINIGDDEGTKTFYLVANVNGTSNSALADVSVGFTTAVEFEALHTDDLTGTKGVLSLTTPLPMSNAVDEANKGVVVDDVLAPGFQAVTLKRRVARFDIVNHEDHTNFTVTGVVVKNGNLSGEILDADLSYAPETGDGVTGDLTATANGNDDFDPATDYETENDPSSGLSQSGKDKSLNPAQFYLYPTTILQDGNGTEIFIVGTFDGEGRVYPLTLSGDVEIKANFVYQIEVQRTETHDFEFNLLAIADWDDYDTETITAGKGPITAEFSNLLSKDGTDLETDEYYYSDKSGDDLELQLVTVSTCDLGVHVAVESIPDNAGYTATQAVVDEAVDVESPAPSLTRSSSALYKQVHVITLKQSSTPFKAEVTVRDRKDPSLVKTYIFSSVGRYPGTNEKPVRKGDRYWAPVNCGATTLVKDFSVAGGIAFTPDNIGYYYQWGRNTPFWPGTFSTTNRPFATIEAAELSDLFVSNENVVEGSPYDSWSGTRAQGPCPTGWRVPSYEDAAILVEGDWIFNSTTKVAREGDFYPGDLYLSGYGILKWTDGTLDRVDRRSWYTTYNISENNPVFIDAVGATGMMRQNGLHQGDAHHVRCVLDEGQ
jgi:hypothetical protein